MCYTKTKLHISQTKGVHTTLQVNYTFSQTYGVHATPQLTHLFKHKPHMLYHNLLHI